MWFMDRFTPKSSPVIGFDIVKMRYVCIHSLSIDRRISSNEICSARRTGNREWAWIRHQEKAECQIIESQFVHFSYYVKVLPCIEHRVIWTFCHSKWKFKFRFDLLDRKSFDLSINWAENYFDIHFAEMAQRKKKTKKKEDKCKSQFQSKCNQFNFNFNS